MQSRSEIRQQRERMAAFVADLERECGQLGRGDVLTHDAIARVLGVGPHEKHWQRCMRKLCRRLEATRGITIWPEVGVGYKLLTPPEQIAVMARRQRRARRQVRRGLAAVASLPDGVCTLHQMQMRNLEVESGRSAIAAISEQLRRAERASRVTEPAPTLAVFLEPR